MALVKRIAKVEKGDFHSRSHRNTITTSKDEQVTRISYSPFEVYTPYDYIVSLLKFLNF